MRLRLAIALLCFPLLTIAQVPIPELPKPIVQFSYEGKDWGVEPPASPTRFPGKYPFHSPTPLAAPGARTILTLELDALMKSRADVVVIDVLATSASQRKTIPGAIWLPDAGDDRFFAAETARFSSALEKLTAGEKQRPIVFLCQNSECWMSYNATLRALATGYRDVLWYRGGTDAWRGASLELKPADRTQW